MTQDQADTKKAIISLLEKSAAGIGVVFVALLSTLPSAWESESLRGPYAFYMGVTCFSLFFAIMLMVTAIAREHVSKLARELFLILGVFSLGIFALGTFGMIAYLAILVRMAPPT